MDETYAGDVDPADSYASLQVSADAVLVDVRTAAEWSYVGLPDLSHIGKRVIPIEWQRFPDDTQNGSFLEQLRHTGVAEGVPIYFLCRSGVRSVAAAKAAAPKKYAHLSARAFKLLAKDPDSYVDKTYYIYGEITQFDAATGTDTFRADVGPKKLKPSYGYVFYPQNSMLTGDESRLSKFVENDLFIAKVTVIGAYSYDTQIGGSTTVPSFHVDSISRYGSSK